VRWKMLSCQVVITSLSTGILHESKNVECEVCDKRTRHSRHFDQSTGTVKLRAATYPGERASMYQEVSFISSAALIELADYFGFVLTRHGQIQASAR